MSERLIELSGEPLGRLELRDVSFAYDREPVLRDVNLSIDLNPPGRLIGLIGATGSGKTTLLRVLAGLLRPSRGEVFLNGRPLYHGPVADSAYRNRVGFLFQHPENQLFETTVAKDVAFGLKHFTLTPGERDARVRAALDAVGLDADVFGDLSPFACSGGEQRRIAIAGVLAREPEVLFLDEPIAGLDPGGRDGLLRLIRDQRAQGRTVLFISHSLDAVAETAERIIVLKEGRIVADGAPETVLDPASESGIKRCPVQELVTALRERGFPMDATVFRYAEMIAGIAGLLGDNATNAEASDEP